MRLPLAVSIACCFVTLSSAALAQTLPRDPVLLALDLASIHGMPDLAGRVLDGGRGDVTPRTAAARAVVRCRLAALAQPPDPDVLLALTRDLSASAALVVATDNPVRRILDTEVAEAWRKAALTRTSMSAEARECATEAFHAFDGVRSTLGGHRALRQADRALWSRVTLRSAEMRLLAAPAIQPAGDRDLVREARQLFDALAVEAESDANLLGWLPHAAVGSARASLRLNDRPSALASMGDFRRSLDRSDPKDPATRAVLDGASDVATALGLVLEEVAPGHSRTAIALPSPPPSPRAEAEKLAAAGRRLEAAAMLESAADAASPEEAESARLEALRLRAAVARSQTDSDRSTAMADVARRALAMIRTRAFPNEAPSELVIRALELRVLAATLFFEAAELNANESFRREALVALALIPEKGIPIPLEVTALALRARIHLAMGAMASAEADIARCDRLDPAGKSVSPLLRAIAERDEALAGTAVDRTAQLLIAARSWRRWLVHPGTQATAAAADAVAWRLFDAGAFAEALSVDEDALTRYPTAAAERGRVRLRAAFGREQEMLKLVRDGKDPSTSLRAAMVHLDMLSKDAVSRPLLDRRDVRALRARLFGGQVVDSQGGMTWLAGVGTSKDAMALWEALRDDGTAPWLWEARFHLVVLSAFDDRAAGRDPASARSAFRALESLYPDLGGRETAARFRWAESAFLR